MDIQDQYVYMVFNYVCDKHLIYSIEISEVFILTYFNISDSEAEHLDITV